MLNIFRNDKPFKCFIGEYEDRQIMSRSYKGIKPIDVEKIVGTVGRCHDNDKWEDLKVQHRFTGIKDAVERMDSMPPIEVYQVGDEYYIVDGHHRVMASREINRDFIDAEIIEYKFKEKNEKSPEKEYHDCPMKEFNEKTGLWGILLKSREAYNNILDSIMEFGRDMGDNFTFKDISSRWYQENYLENIDKDKDKNTVKDKNADVE